MAKRGTSDFESRFCGKVGWNDHASGKDWKVTWTLEEQEEKLTREANNNPPFKTAWEEAAKDPKLSSLKTQYSTLVESDIKLIMAYTYDLPGRFYIDLNTDCRGSGSKYPIARTAMRAALIKLTRVQPALPGELYRKEGLEQMDKYVNWKLKGPQALEAFTSTSRSKDGFVSGGGKTLTITFKNPKFGADISEFSPYDEKECLLIPEYGAYMAESVDQQKAMVVMYRHI